MQNKLKAKNHIYCPKSLPNLGQIKTHHSCCGFNLTLVKKKKKKKKKSNNIFFQVIHLLKMNIKTTLLNSLI